MAKGILKKVKGKLKIAIGHIIGDVFLLAGFGGGVVGVLSTSATGGIMQHNIKEDYYNSKTYISVKADEVEELTRSFKAGEITEYDYNKKREYFDSEEYRDELLRRNYPQDYEYHAKLKISDNLLTASWSIGVAGAGLGALGIVFSCRGVDEKLIDSGEKDLENWSYTVSANPPPPKPKKKKKEKMKEKDEKEDEEEYLMDTDEYLSQFQSQE